MPELLPRFHAWLEKVEAERAVAKAVLDGGEVHPDANGRVLRASADGHRSDRRRGLPMISKGVSGTMPGTDPLAALIRRENGRRRR